MEAIGLAAVLDDKNFQAGLKRYSAGIGQMTKMTDGAARVLSGAFFAATGLAVAGLGAMVAASKLGLDATLAWAEQLDKLGDQFGLSGEKASGWAFLMNKVGLSVDEGAQGLNYFTKQLDDFGKATATGKVQLTPFMTALQKLGVNAYTAGGKLKDFDTIMPEIMDQFEKLPAGVNASALAMDLFGARGGTKFLDFLRQGGAGLKEATAKAHELGLELSTDEVNAAEQFGFALNELKLSLSGVWNIIGRAVLPVARDFVNLLNDKVVPVLADLARRIAPVLARTLQDVSNIFRELFAVVTAGGPVLENLAARVSDALRARWPEIENTLRTWAARFWNWLTQDVLPKAGAMIGQVATAVAQSIAANAPAIAQAAGAWANGFWNWITNQVIPQVGAKLGQYLAAIQAWAATNGPAIGQAFMVLGESFWDWLVDSKSGVIPRIGAVLGNWVYSMQLWVTNPKNTEPIWTAMLGWVAQFWNWVTGKGGLVDTVFSTMANLTAEIEKWSKDPATQKWLNDIGETVANTIIDGIGNLFKDQGKADGTMNHLVTSLDQARINLANSFANIGGSIAAGMATAIAERLTGKEMVESLRASFNAWMSAAVQAFVLGDIGPLIGMIVDAIMARFFGGKAPATNAPAYTPPPKPYAHGGYVPYDMLAQLHGGEYVIPASQVNSAVYNSRTIMPGAVVLQFEGGSSLSERQIEQAVYRGVKLVMDAA